MRATSSTTFELWFLCPYAHYLYTRKGIINVDEEWHAEIGNIIHDAVEALCFSTLLSKVLQRARLSCSSVSGFTPDGVPRSKEIEWLVIGLILTFNKFFLPRFQHNYQPILAEQEITIPLTHTLSWCCRPDLIVKRHTDERMFNANIKSTAFMNDVHMNHEFSVQMLMEQESIRKAWNLDTAGSIILSFNKGQRGKPTKQDLEDRREGFRLESPFTYVWWNTKKDTWQEKYVWPGEKIAVWDIVDSPESWFEKVSQEAAIKTIDISDPILYDSRMDLEEVKKEIIDIDRLTEEGFYPKHRSACNSFGTYRHPCPYRLWCYGTEQERSDNFIPRTPNHPFEAVVMEE